MFLSDGHHHHHHHHHCGHYSAAVAHVFDTIPLRFHPSLCALLSIHLLNDHELTDIDYDALRRPADDNRVLLL